MMILKQILFGLKKKWRQMDAVDLRLLSDLGISKEVTS